MYLTPQTVTELKDKLKEKNEEMVHHQHLVARISTEIECLKHILEEAKPAEVKSRPIFSEAIPGAAKPGDPFRGKRQSKVLEILENFGVPMKSEVIRNELESYGMQTNKNTFDAMMSKLFRDGKVHKPSYGHYQSLTRP